MNALPSQPCASKAIPPEEKTNCNDQPLQNMPVLWITVQELENSVSVVLKVPLSYYKHIFYLISYLWL